MTTPSGDVLDEMAAIWRLGNASPDLPARNRALSARDVRDALAGRFGEEAVRAKVIAFLDHLCGLYQRDRTPDATDRYLADCALTLITEEGGVQIPTELVQRIVRLFPPAVWHFPVGHLIARYLTFTQLADTLVAGIVNPAHPGALEDALTGFRLYFGKAQPDSDPAKQRVSKLAFDKLDELARSSDPEISRLAKNASVALENHAT